MCTFLDHRQGLLLLAAGVGLLHFTSVSGVFDPGYETAPGDVFLVDVMATHSVLQYAVCDTPLSSNHFPSSLFCEIRWRVT